MHDATATELKLVERTDLPPCPSCRGETSEEFVANGPSQGLRLTCRTCGPIDVMGCPGLEETAEEGDAPVETGADELRFVASTDSEEAFDVAPEAPEEEEKDDGQAAAEEPTDETDLHTEASDLVEEAAQEEAEPEAAPHARYGEDLPLTAFEPSDVLARPRRTVDDPGRRARNRQVAVIGLGGMALIATLVVVDIYLRPIDPPSPRVASSSVVPEAEASVPPASTDIPRPETRLSDDAPTAAAASAPDAASVTRDATKRSVANEKPNAPVSGDEATGSAPAPSAEAASAKPVTAPAAAEKPETRVATEAVADTRGSETRWFSQTGVPPTRNGNVDPGAYRPGAAQRKPPILVARATAPRETRALIVDEPAEKQPAKPVDPSWRGLRKGMTGEQVARVLGAPRWKTNSVAFEFWMYETRSIMASGVVVFENGTLSTWRDPAS